jgi:Kef-type K+ transport system membrane component KefB
MMLTLAGFDEAGLFPAARSSLTFGFLLLTAYLVGDVLSWLALPRITGYILAGVVLGPYALMLVDATTVRDLKLIDDLALTFIALAAGGELRLAALRERSRVIAWTVVAQAVVILLGIGALTLAARSLLPFLADRPLQEVLVVATLLGVFAMARSPASAIAVISECKARGPFTEMVLGVTVIMDVLVIVVFAAAVSLGQAVVAPAGGVEGAFFATILLELAGSLLGGALLGWIISLYIRWVKAELAVFILAVAFLVTFSTRQFGLLLDQVYSVSFHLEPMLVCLTAGFWVRNFSRGGELFMEKIDRSALPIYVIFFSLTGAALRLDALAQTWLAALLLVAARGVLIWVGAWLGGRLGGDPQEFRRASGLGFLAQAGVSLGLAGIVMQRFPDWGPALATTIVAVISLNQLVGPVAFKHALAVVGEARVNRDRRTP